MKFVILIIVILTLIVGVRAVTKKRDTPIQPEPVGSMYHDVDFFDATDLHPDARGYQYAEYDPVSERALFYPWGKIVTDPGGIFLVYDTKKEFTSSESYDVVDLTKLLMPEAHGFGIGFIDVKDRWSYFVPFRKDVGRGQEGNDVAIRFNLDKQPADATAYEMFRLSSMDNPPPHVGWITGALIDGYAYFTPFGESIPKSPWHIPHGILLRYNTRKAFDDEKAWEWYDLQQLHAKATGFQSVVAHGNYLYLIPYYPGNDVVVRYDVSKSFVSPDSYTLVDLKKIHPGAIGYTGVIVVGDSIVLVPWRKDVTLKNLADQSASLAAIYNTRKDIEDPKSWDFFDLTELHPDARGYQFGWTDTEGYVHFSPMHNFATKLPPPFVIWDSHKPFSDPTSWQIYPSSGMPASAGGAYNGTYAWLAPYGRNGDSGTITRILFKAPDRD